MKKYLVGGAVRDKLLGQEPRDRDYCVVGSTVEEMLSLGYFQIGNRFPVFTHPETQEEHALARMEIKVGNTYKDFEPIYDKNTSLEQDLKRRDITINAIAYDEENDVFIDPYGGIEDLNNKILKHVSDHFAEDPFRLVRLARFQAKLPDFTIAPETVKLCKSLVVEENKENLCDDRLLKEFKKTFDEVDPKLFFSTLQEFGFFKLFFFKELPLNYKESLVHNDLEKNIAHFLYLLELSESQYNEISKGYFKGNTRIHYFYSSLDRMRNVEIQEDSLFKALNSLRFNQSNSVELYEFFDKVFKNEFSKFLIKTEENFKKVNIASLKDKQDFYKKEIKNLLTK